MKPTDKQFREAYNVTPAKSGDGWYLACIVALIVIGGVAVLGLLLQCGG